MNLMRAEADKAILRAEDAEAKIKTLQEDSLGKDHTISSLNHKLQLAHDELEKTEAELKKLKQESLDDEQSKTAKDGLARKVELLEEELDAAEKNHKETVEKCAAVYLILFMLIMTRFGIGYDRSM
jgi:tropomyosin, fungi type